ncbi:MAG TPA: Dabb family protein [Bordetella sp.]|nr:Dabb family protein [Bordetella sp.]
MAKIKHVCAFRFRDDVEDSIREDMLNELMSFPKKFPGMKNWLQSRNVSQRDDRFSHAFIVEFDTEHELLAYLNSSSHETFVKERFRPIIQERAIITLQGDD